MHLQHKIPWAELVECLRIDDTEISLPVGKCGKIHLIDKATEIKVSSRNFLTQNDICTSKDCETAANHKTFSKNRLSMPNLSTTGRRSCMSRKKQLKYVNEKFFETILEFVASEEKKFPATPNFSTSIIPEPLDMRCTECYSYPCTYGCKGLLVFSLYSNYEIEKLLWLDRIGKVSVKDALSRTYGGQAVGNGYRYLVLYHLLPFYVISNAIIACGYESNEEKWGELAADSYFRRTIEYDNDFLTFVPTLRPYLDKNVYMKDMGKTIELLRIVFRHIYVYVYLMKKFLCYSDSQMRQDFEIHGIFRFGDLD